MFSVKMLFRPSDFRHKISSKINKDNNRFCEIIFESELCTKIVKVTEQLRYDTKNFAC